MSGSTYRGRVETITPEMAIKWLEKNTDNRVLTQSKVDAYAADILAGKWILTGDPIQFNVLGEMINGQHRLWAIVQADQAIECYVVRGLPVEAKLVIDTGAKRTLANYFQIKKEPNATVLASIITTVYVYDINRYTTAMRGPTHSEAEEILADNPGFRDSAKIGVHARRGVGLAPSPMASAHAINARTDSEAADEFWANASEGVGLEAGDPIIAYRRWAVRMLQLRDRPTTRTQFMFAMKAMEYWRKGKRVRSLSWNGGDGVPLDWSMFNGKRPR